MVRSDNQSVRSLCLLTSTASVVVAFSNIKYGLGGISILPQDKSVRLSNIEGAYHWIGDDATVTIIIIIAMS